MKGKQAAGRGTHDDDLVSCPACDCQMMRGGSCPECGHSDRVDCDCELCSRLAADGWGEGA